MACGAVKWFNPTKGFGFICPDDGGPDVFVHVAEVNSAGLAELGEGARIEYDLAPRPGTNRSCATNLRPASTPPPAIQLTERGKVSHYNEDRGFGFIAPVTGGGDVFVHVSAVRGAGLDGLREGQQVRFASTLDPRTQKPKVRSLDLV